jgi:hypothetical protein
MQKTSTIPKVVAIFLAAIIGVTIGVYLEDKSNGAIGRAGHVLVAGMAKSIRGYFKAKTTATGIATQILEGEKRNLRFGPYNWRVLAMLGDRALLLAEHNIETRAFHGSQTSITWAACDLRVHLNGIFLEKFNAGEHLRMLEAKNMNPANPQYGTNGGIETTDKFFLLSIEEARIYFAGDGDRSIGHWWWLRSPGEYTDDVAIILGDGHVDVDGRNANDAHGGIRPALWIDLTL